MASQIRLFPLFEPPVQRGQLKACEICATKFSVFVPEHQCKRCLRAVCSSCAGNKRDVYKPKMSRKPHRLCKFCNTQSTILYEYIADNKLAFGQDSQLAREWYKKLPKSSGQSSSFKQYRKFSIQTFNQLWDYYNFSLRQFIGLLTYTTNQNDIFMLINNVYTQLQSRGIDQKMENIIPIIAFMLCYSGADLCTDLVEHLVNLKKNVSEPKQLLQVYLKTLGIEESQSKKLNDYINYKIKQFIGPYSINAVTAQSSIHVITRAFQKQRIDQNYMLLAIILQNNWDMLLKNKGNQIECDFKIIRNCDMGVYIGKFKVLTAVNVSQYTTPKLSPSKKQDPKSVQKFNITEQPIPISSSINFNSFTASRTTSDNALSLDSDLRSSKPVLNKVESMNDDNKSAGSTPPKPDYSKRESINGRQSLQFGFGRGSQYFNKQFKLKQTVSYQKNTVGKHDDISEQSMDEQSQQFHEMKNKQRLNQQKLRKNNSTMSAKLGQQKQQNVKRQANLSSFSSLLVNLGNNINTMEAKGTAKEKKQTQANASGLKTNNEGIKRQTDITISSGSPAKTSNNFIQIKSNVVLQNKPKSKNEPVVHFQKQFCNECTQKDKKIAQLELILKQKTDQLQKYELKQKAMRQSQANTKDQQKYKASQAANSFDLQLGQQQALFQAQLEKQQKKSQSVQKQYEKSKKQYEQLQQKYTGMNKQLFKYQRENLAVKNQLDEIKMTNRLLKDKIQEKNLGFDKNNSNQREDQLTKVNELMKKTIENKNIQLQGLMRKNKELSLQLEQYMAKTLNQTDTSQQEKQPTKKKQFEKQKELLLQKMKELSQRVVKQEGEKLQMSQEIFQLKRERSLSMVVTSTTENMMNSNNVSNANTETGTIEELKARVSQCQIF